MRVSKQRRLHLSIFISLLLGTLFFSYYFLDLDNVKDTRVGIIFHCHPSHDWEINNFHYLMTVVPDNHTIELTIYFTYYFNKTYYFAVTFPYQIKNTIEFYSPPNPGIWDSVNTKTGSILYAVFNGTNVKKGVGDGRISQIIYFNESIVQKKHGDYNLVLPFGGSYTIDIQNKMKALPFPLNAPSSIYGQLKVSLEPSAVIVGNSLQIVQKDPIPRGGQLLEFSIEEIKPFNIRYKKNQEELIYSLFLFLSGIFLGTGFKKLVDLWIDSAVYRR